MTGKEIIEGNKLIAKFMEIKLEGKWRDGYDYALQHVYRFNDEYYDCTLPTDFGFHFSWDWLMPVVEKIETIKIEEYNINFSIMGKAACWTPSHWCGLKTYLADSKIEAVYMTVIEFIKWYNSNKKY